MMLNLMGEGSFTALKFQLNFASIKFCITALFLFQDTIVSVFCIDIAFARRGQASQAFVIMTFYFIFLGTQLRITIIIISNITIIIYTLKRLSSFRGEIRGV